MLARLCHVHLWSGGSASWAEPILPCCKGCLIDLNRAVSMCLSVHLCVSGLRQDWRGFLNLLLPSREKSCPHLLRCSPHCPLPLLLLLLSIPTSSWIVVSDNPTAEGPKLNVTSPGSSVIPISWLGLLPPSQFSAASHFISPEGDLTSPTAALLPRFVPLSLPLV